jgi:biopolymer transport protein TolR
VARGRAGHSQRRWRLTGKKHEVEHVRNDINVTPLVDVMLVLLIIFMLMVLLLGRGFEVNLPKANNYSQEKDKTQPVVSIDSEGNLYVEKTKLGPVNPSSIKDMGDLVKAAWASPKNPEAVNRIYLKADYEIDYGKIYKVLFYLNAEPPNGLGIQRVDLAIAREK